MTRLQELYEALGVAASGKVVGVSAGPGGLCAAERSLRQDR